ncbi:ferredoxin [Planosporangium mesophilum]|uniref:ferredoxin n=1 Tax=Planosporangium mesophilum TaxID=689768 RepID=UPI00195038D5|nr:ferredoxin [Planosporangium mesophilum]
MYSDPVLVLTLITVVLWLAVIGWRLWRRERADGEGRSARGWADEPDWDETYADGFDEAETDEDEAPDWDDEPRPAERPLPAAQRAEVAINPGKCMRFAFCEHEAPAVFKLTGDRIDYKPSVPADQVDAVAMAVKVCPARAITMKLPGVKPYLPQPPVDDDARRPVRR